LPLFKQKLLLWCYYINMVMGVVYEDGVVTFLIFFIQNLVEIHTSFIRSRRDTSYYHTSSSRYTHHSLHLVTHHLVTSYTHNASRCVCILDTHAAHIARLMCENMCITPTHPFPNHLDVFRYTLPMNSNYNYSSLEYI
jgi:hypothetical protein